MNDTTTEITTRRFEVGQQVSHYLYYDGHQITTTWTVVARTASTVTLKPLERRGTQDGGMAGTVPFLTNLESEPAERFRIGRARFDDEVVERARAYYGEFVYAD